MLLPSSSYPPSPKKERRGRRFVSQKTPMCKEKSREEVLLCSEEQEQKASRTSLLGENSIIFRQGEKIVCYVKRRGVLFKKKRNPSCAVFAKQEQTGERQQHKTKTLCRPARQMGGRFSTAEDIMLILTRKPGESIRIGDEIIVVVKSISGKTVRLGIAAPSSVGVYREELYAQIQETQAEKEESASPDGIDPSEDLPHAHDAHPSNPHQITLLVEEKSS